MSPYRNKTTPCTRFFFCTPLGGDRVLSRPVSRLNHHLVHSDAT